MLIVIHGHVRRGRGWRWRRPHRRRRRTGGSRRRRPRPGKRSPPSHSRRCSRWLSERPGSKEGRPDRNAEYKLGSTSLARNKREEGMLTRRWRCRQWSRHCRWDLDWGPGWGWGRGRGWGWDWGAKGWGRGRGLAGVQPGQGGRAGRAAPGRHWCLGVRLGRGKENREKRLKGTRQRPRPDEKQPWPVIRSYLSHSSRWGRARSWWQDSSGLGRSHSRPDTRTGCLASVRKGRPQGGGSGRNVRVE